MASEHKRTIACDELYSLWKAKGGIPLRKRLKMKQIAICKAINKSGTHRADADECP